MKFQRVDPSAKRKWRLSRILALIFGVVPSAGLILLITSAVARETWRPAETVGIVLAVLLLMAQLLQIILYPVIEYAQWEYLIAPDRIEIKKGIFYRTHTIIPISRLQHVAVTQSVLQKPFGLANVQLHTAGDVMEIQEVSMEMAEKICAYLQKRIHYKSEYSDAPGQARRVRTEG